MFIVPNHSHGSVSPIYDGNSGFVAVQRQWAINDGKTPEEARFQTETPVAGRDGELKATFFPKTSHNLKDNAILNTQLTQPIE